MRPPNIKIISYNLRKHKASKELSALVDTHEIDVLCLQECRSDQLPKNVQNLELAYTTPGNRMGLAVYYNRDRFILRDADSFTLRKSLHDRFLTPNDRRLLPIKIEDSTTGKQFVIASFHAAPLTALNHIRRKQIQTAYEIIDEFGSDSLPVVMVGDYNYPLFKQKLTRMVESIGYEMSLSNKRTYSGLLRGHFDFATSANIAIDSVETLPKGKSDHKPILVTVALA